MFFVFVSESLLVGSLGSVPAGLLLEKVVFHPLVDMIDGHFLVVIVDLEKM
jgi:ribosomal protein L13